MLRRLCPYGLRGFWYYQGEQDEEWPEDYLDLLSTLINRWRQDWGDETLPFLLMQLPMYGGESEMVSPMSWPLLRKAQSDAAECIPGVELAVLADCGEFDNIHPTKAAGFGSMAAASSLPGLMVSFTTHRRN